MMTLAVSCLLAAPLTPLRGTLSSDPMTGDILIATKAGELYSLDLKKREWTHHEERQAPWKDWKRHPEPLTTPIPNCGISFFLAGTKVYLYRHADLKQATTAPDSPDPTPESVEAEPSAQPDGD